MKFPTLSEAFCCCSLRLGTMIIAWIQIVLTFIFFGFFVTIVVVTKYTFDAAEKMKNEEVMKNNFDDNEEKMFSQFVLRFGAIAVTFITVILIIQMTACILLLVGAQKGRPGYLIFWLILTVLCLIGSLKSLKLEGIVYFLINAYFAWVVYSLYRQLKDNPDCTTQPAPRDVKMQGDNVLHNPTHVIPDAPPAYAYTQREF